MRLMVFVLSVAVCAFAAWAAEPQRPLVYGEAVQGVAAAMVANPQENGSVTVTLRNQAAADLSLKDGFVWLLFVQSREKAFFSQRVPLADQGHIAPDSTVSVKLDLKTLAVGAYEKGMKVVGGYPEREVGQNTIAKELPDVAIRVQAILYIPAAGEKLMLKSGAISVLMLNKAHAATTVPADAAGLLERFRRDAFAAKAAHDVAVREGPPMVPVLAGAMNDQTMPDFGRMWMATALVDIGGDEAGKAVAGLVNDKSEGVRDVVAYHGPAMKSPLVDAAIMTRAKEGKDSLFVAWAARGFHEKGRSFPEGLLQAAVSSSEPRARGQIAEVLAARGSEQDMRPLARLCTDADELVRIAAADAVAKHAIKAATVTAALVHALKLPGENARERIVGTLAKLQGKTWQYSADGNSRQNAATIKEIEKWWAEVPVSNLPS